jgi:outer membrane protein TolC
VDRTFENGLALSGALALDVVNLLRPNWASSMGLVGDASLTLPLLRGAGRHIVTEPLTQAERSVVYAIWDFERFKRTFAVSVASQHLSVLQQVEEVKNADDDYGRAIRTARRSRRLAEAGRLSQVELDQAVQDELRSRNSWISAQERLKGSLDAFKRTIGLPTDALIELDRRDLEQLTDQADQVINELIEQQDAADSEAIPPADAPVVLEPPTREGAGPFELQESVAIDLALENRLDLRVANGEVYDAQRQVVVQADALRSALGVRATAATGRGEDDILRFDNGSYSASLLLDLPLERTAERNAYRQSLISLERATRSVQTLEDQIKLSIRDELRALLESRETVNIQALGVVLAEKRVTMSNLFLEAGRAQIRDVLEAQQALLSARNNLTAAVVSYRVAELELQRDTGVLQVDERGLWQEFKPEEIEHGEAK